MNVGTRIKHAEYGTGTIINIFFENTVREMYLIEFDVSNSELHDGLGFVKPQHGYFTNGEDIEVI